MSDIVEKFNRVFASRRGAFTEIKKRLPFEKPLFFRIEERG
jgi:hypothetical protein